MHPLFRQSRARREKRDAFGDPKREFGHPKEMGDPLRRAAKVAGSSCVTLEADLRKLRANPERFMGFAPGLFEKIEAVFAGKTQPQAQSPKRKFGAEGRFGTAVSLQRNV